MFIIRRNGCCNVIPFKRNSYCNVIFVFMVINNLVIVSEVKSIPVQFEVVNRIFA